MYNILYCIVMYRANPQYVPGPFGRPTERTSPVHDLFSTVPYEIYYIIIQYNI